MERLFGPMPYRGSRINSVILTDSAEVFWFVHAVLSRGGIEFNISRDEVTREEFNIVKKWCSMNSGRIGYDIIDKILSMLRLGNIPLSDAVPVCDIPPYSQLQPEIEALNLVTVSDILQP